MLSQLKTWHLLVFISLLSIALLSCLSRGKAPARADVISSMTNFEGGTFEASGIAAVPKTNGVLLVDNGRPSQVLWLGLDEAGKQAGQIKPVNLGANIEDIEGITTDGTYFYVVSSQSRPKAIATAGLVRFKFDPRDQSVSGVESISGLKNFLGENVVELREQNDRMGKHGGLNIEGLAWDPSQSRLLLGLRSPIVNGQALVIPLKFRNQLGPFATDNLQALKAMPLPLGGLGIRGIEYDSEQKGFKIISGAAEDQAQADFGLWEWNGDEQRPVVREITRFDKRLKPEGVARVQIGSRGRLVVVFDASGYTIID